MAEYKLISADSHVSEPPDLWATRVDQKYRDRAPRLAVDLPGKEGAYFLYEGYAPHPIGIGLGAGKSPEELAEFLTKATYADARPGGWDPAERVKDNDLDGVEADVLYTTLGFILTMSLMLFALIAFEGRNLVAAAVYSVGISLVTYGLFTVVLKSPLDQGILGF